VWVLREIMRAPHLDILKRQSDGGFVWIEASNDVRVAEERISHLAETEPGEYFVFDQRTQQIVAKVTKQPTG
jgi:pyridoxine/pyridoxamine 5'-phosphate oxidase